MAMAQLNWNDIFECVLPPLPSTDLDVLTRHTHSFSSLDEPSITPPSPLDPTQHDICSDFTCCGLALPDLHALVDHFEEHHVLVGHNGRLASSPLILSYPQPDPPAEPSALFGCTPPFASAAAAALHLDVPEYDLSDGTSDSASHSSGSTFPSPNPSEPTCLPPSLLTVHPPLPPDVLPATLQPALHRERERHKDRPHAPARQKAARAKAQLLGAAHHPAIQARLPPAETQRKRRSRSREKAYKCPRPGCTKAYLNPNGLKYHLEKGTCTIAVLPDPADDVPRP
ncbi:hypothetical protein DAEQUDRAFT_370488 [Daedalea quercina L-15889]|uniref:C2H2-type domain-containing protein n=1 Tax=Daedalea quercina L-15889 TaxID=1314783 RepID=A0A165PB65_9APHY|nr:hypothetical protein DAEQUDRAFT_370488 [Daedalea quercina L-15889]